MYQLTGADRYKDFAGRWEKENPAEAGLEVSSWHDSGGTSKIAQALPVARAGMGSICAVELT